MDFVSFERLTLLNLWPVDDKAPLLGPSSTKTASREVAHEVPEQKRKKKAQRHVRWPTQCLKRKK